MIFSFNNNDLNSLYAKGHDTIMLWIQMLITTTHLICYYVCMMFFWIHLKFNIDRCFTMTVSLGIISRGSISSEHHTTKYLNMIIIVIL